MGEHVKERSPRGTVDWDTQGSGDFWGGGILLVLLPGAPEHVVFQQVANRASTASHCTVVHQTASRIWQALAVSSGAITPPLFESAIEARVRASGFPSATLLQTVETCSAAHTANKLLRSRDYATAIVGAGGGTFSTHRATRLARMIQRSVHTQLFLR